MNDRFVAFIYEVAWITSVYCYLKQEQAIRESKNKVNWLGKQIGRVLNNDSAWPLSKSEPQPSTPDQSTPLIAKRPFVSKPSATKPGGPSAAGAAIDETASKPNVSSPPENDVPAATDNVPTTVGSAADEPPTDENATDAVTTETVPDESTGVQPTEPAADQTRPATPSDDKKPDGPTNTKKK